MPAAAPERVDWRAIFTTPLGLFWTLSYATFVLLALFVPKTVLDDWPQAQAFTDFVAAIVPQIDPLTRRSGDAAQVNRLVYSAIWALAPFYASVLAVQFYRLGRRYGFKYGSYAHFAAILLGSCGLRAILLFLPLEGQSRASKALYASDLVRALWTPLGAFGPAVIAVAIGINLWCAFTGRLGLEDKK